MKRPSLFLLAIALAHCSEEPAPPPPWNSGQGPASPIDPLSMPASPTLDPSAFAPADRCAACHPQHYEEWRTSMHAYSMKDPLFRALVQVRQRDFGGERDAFCTQCHSAIGTRGGECVPGFSFESLSPIVQEGVTCEACHKIASQERISNSGHVLDPGGPMRGPIADPMPTSAHVSAYSELFDRSEICGGCHDVVEFSGLPLERAYAEWRDSPSARDGQNCQSCHLPATTGPVTPGGPDRARHEHRFVGVDLPLTPDFLSPEARTELRGRISNLLRESASLRLDTPPSLPIGQRLDVVLTVKNLINGHSLPTGSTFHRQLWVEVIVTDQAGRVLYRTGHLDDAGDLRDHYSTLDPYGDPDLIRFGSLFVDARGNRTLFPWQAAEHFSTAIPPGYARTQTIFVDTSSAALGPIQVQARLLFRSTPPFLLRILGLGEAADQLPIYEITTASTAVFLE